MSTFPEHFERVCKTLDGFVPAPRNLSDGYQVLDFFSGCGGMSLGFHAYATTFGNIGRFVGFDIFPKAVSTYGHNIGQSTLCDVRALAASADIIGALDALVGFDPDRPTVLIGCPPCQGFSAHTRTRGIPDDERNALILDFAEIALAIKPEALIIENVPEILAGKYRRYWDSFEARLNLEGYTFTADIHNLASLGVPQQRNRAVCFALRGPSMPLPDLLKTSEFRTVRAAIGDLPPLLPGERSADPLHRTVKHRQTTLDVIAQVPKDGGSRPRGIGPACLDRTKGFYDVYGRLAWERPSITVTRYSRSPASGRFTHPEQDRGLSAREVARIQTFPDGFEFSGALDDIYRQIGEAVPPRAAAAVATWVMDQLNEVSPAQRNESTNQELQFALY